MSWLLWCMVNVLLLLLNFWFLRIFNVICLVFKWWMFLFLEINNIFGIFFCYNVRCLLFVLILLIIVVINILVGKKCKSILFNFNVSLFIVRFFVVIF